MNLVRIVFAILLAGSSSIGQQSKTDRFERDGLAFDYSADWSLKDESTSNEQVIYLERTPFDRMMVFSPRLAIRTPQEFVAARVSWVDPTIDELVKVVDTKGGKVDRQSVFTEIGGIHAEGVRLRFSLDGQARVFEIYWVLLGERLLSANFLTTEQTSGKTVAAWDLLRRSLKASQTATPTPCDSNLNNDQLLEMYKRALGLKEQQRFDEAIELFECVVRTFERVLVKPEQQEALVIPLNELGQLYMEKASYAKAASVLQRALKIAEQTSPTSENTALSLNNLAALYEAQGQYASAEPLMKRALEIFEKIEPPATFELTASLNNLAQVYYAQGKLVEAEPLYLRAIAIIEKLPQTEATQLADNYAQILDSLGQLYDERGDYTGAETSYKRAIAIADASTERKHPKLSQFLNNLGLLYYRIGNYPASKQLLMRALDMKMKALGQKHPEVATTLNNLGLLLKIDGSYEEAIKAHQTALAIREQVLPPNHPDLALSLNNLATLYKETGQYDNSEQFFKRALRIYEAVLGPRSPYVALTLTNLGVLFEAKGDTRRALEYLSRGLDVRESNLSLFISIGSEAQKLSYMSLLTGETHSLVSQDVALGGKDPQATRLALTTVLRRKGRVLDVISEEIAALRRRVSVRDRVLLDQVSTVRSQLATLIFRGPGELSSARYQELIKKLESEEQRLEAEVSLRNTEYGVQRQAVSIQSIQQLIPGDNALVEFVRYRPFDPTAKQVNAFLAPRYAVYVLRKTGEPMLIPLKDEAAIIDSNIVKLRAKMRRPNQDVAPLARTVDAEVMQPVREAFPALRKFLISPDGALNFIPFAALVDERNQYLVQNYSISYLTTGRDLLRLRRPSHSRQPPVAVANPLFSNSIGGTISTAGPERTRGTSNSEDFRNLKFPPLPETTQEARIVKAYLPATTVLVDSSATEAAFRNLKGPLILHVATHGFFLPDQRGPASRTSTLVSAQSDLLEVPNEEIIENPLLRAGLWLAGANLREGGGQDDGVLTALETGSLDLDGTELVVLSACETGVGDLQDGEGVYGLRRALFIAGVRSAVVSLWKVASDGTAELMTKYYEHLLRAHEGRAETLRQVQLEMLKSKGTSNDRSDPYFWAGFIPLGDWTSLKAR